jgi:hypothetical protein
VRLRPRRVECSHLKVQDVHEPRLGRSVERVPPLTESSTLEQRRDAADDVFHCLCCRSRQGDNVSALIWAGVLLALRSPAPPRAERAWGSRGFVGLRQGRLMARCARRSYSHRMGFTGKVRSRR